MATILKQKMKTVFMPTALALLISACASENLVTQSIKNEAYASSEFYMNKIGQTQKIEDQQTYKLLAARVLVTENKVPQAQALLNELSTLNPDQLLDKSLIEAHIAAVQGNKQHAEDLLRRVDLTQLSSSQVGRYYAVKARIAENKNAIIDAVKARIQMDQVLTDVPRKQENNDRTCAL